MRARETSRLRLHASLCPHLELDSISPSARGDIEAGPKGPASVIRGTGAPVRERGAGTHQTGPLTHW
jgi:hypothetical protein